jgi:ABC-type Mn2+/Zn2+ transport system permease subunit
MTDTFLIFGLPFLASVLAGGVIAASGVFLIPQGKVLSLLALGQAVILGRVVANLFDLNSTPSFLLCLTFYYLTYLFLFFSARFKTVTDIFSVALYFTFLAIGFFLLRLYPGLEFGLVNAFYNDVVSLSYKESLLAICLFLLANILLMCFYKYFLKQNFLYSVLHSRRPLSFLFFDFSLILAFYYFGSLFTMGFLLLPGVIFGNRMQSFFQSFFLAFISGYIASAGGFLLSLEYHRFSTIPSQVILCLIISISMVFVCSRRKR